MLCPKLPIWDPCQRPRPRVGSPRRLIMLTNAHSQVSQRVMSVTDIHRDSEGGSLSYRMSWNTNASFSLSAGVKCQGMWPELQWPGPGCPNVPKFSVKCVLVRARHSAEMLSEKQSGQARLVRDKPLQANSMKPMSNMIVLALVVIWNCNVSMKMPPKIDFFISRKDLRWN